MADETPGILYIDDDEDDLLIFGESIENLYPGIAVLKAPGGEEGIALLNLLEQECRPFPHLIILDMNMPRMDGRQTLKAIRSKEQWAGIPVVIFTTSTSVRDIEFSQSHGTACITKPMNYESLGKVVRLLLSYCSPPLNDV
jgi:CheY-like chemotaxis protein